MEDRLLTARELAQLLRVTRDTVLVLFRGGKIPGIRLGGSVRFSPSAIEDWLDRSSVTPTGDRPPAEKEPKGHPRAFGQARSD
jgi:excisionase family DNA binding protein